MHYWSGGYFDDFGGIDPRRAIEMSRLSDPSQMVDPLYNSSQMVDLSQGYDLSRLDSSQAQNFGRAPSLLGHSGPHLLPGEGVIGLFGMFEGDFFTVGGGADSPPRPRGLLILGKKTIKKAWKPRVLGAVEGRPVRHGGHHRPRGPGGPQPMYYSVPYTDPQSLDAQQLLAIIELQQTLIQTMAAQRGGGR